MKWIILLLLVPTIGYADNGGVDAAQTMAEAQHDAVAGDDDDN